MKEFINCIVELYNSNPGLFGTIGLILAVLGFLGIGIPIVKIFKKIWGLFKKKENESKELTPPDYYKFIWKDAKELTPEDILGLRGMKQYGFKKYYYRREFHKELVKRIRGGKNAIVVGMSLSGKTRTVYQALKSLGAGYSVTLLEKFELVDKPDLTIPPLSARRDVRKRVLVIDDINNFIGKLNFDMLLQNFMKDGVTVVATCRTGPDLAGYAGTDLSTYFQKPIEIAKLEIEDVKEIVKKIKVQPPDSFDWNIGSLFLPLSIMKARYSELNREEKRVLKAINRLHFGGVSIQKGVFPLDRAKRYYEEKNSLKIDEGEFKNLLEDLNENEFLEFERNWIRVEEAYLDEVIEVGKPSPEDFAEMIQIFNDDPQALFDLGVRAGQIGWFDIKIRDYMKVSILAYLGALKFWSKDNVSWSQDKEKYMYLITKRNLGKSYEKLSSIEDTSENLEEAMKTYIEILDILIYEKLVKFPIDYSVIELDLWNIFTSLAKTWDKEKNYDRARSAYEEMLEIFKKAKITWLIKSTASNIEILNEICNEEGE